MHALHQESLIFHGGWPCLVQSFLRFPPVTQESLVFDGSFPRLMKIFLSFSTLLSFPSSDATFLHSSIVLAPLRQNPWFFFPGYPLFWCNIFPHWPYCTKNPWVITGFPSSDARFPTFFHFFGPTAPRVLGFFHRISPHAWPYCAHNCWAFTGLSSSDAFTGFLLFWCYVLTQTIL